MQQLFSTRPLPRPSWAERHPGLWAACAALGLFVCAAALAVLLQNGSTYATGSWDDYSQQLVFGRMLQMQQDQSAPGGFMGVYTPDWGDSQNRYWYRDNTPVDAADFHSYTHQSGLQGWALGVLNKIYSVFQPDGAARETMLYTTNAVLFYWLTLALCLALRRAAGWLPALGWLAAALLAPGVQTGMKDLYWCLWTWLLPALAGVLLCAATLRRGRTPCWAYLLMGAACLLRCMCGFEFISSFLILAEIPLAFCWAAALAGRQPGRPWFFRMVRAGLSALGGVAAALLVWLCQGYAYYGSWGESLTNILGAAGSRISVSDGAVRQGVTIPGVLFKYFAADATPALRLGGLEVASGPLLAAALAAAAAAAAALPALRRRDLLRALAPSACLWALAVAAPASWLILSKVHSDVHSHLIPVLFQITAVPASLALLGAAASLLFRAVARRGKKA
ncbi:MAG TPA: hypothetical protein H9915_07060 [Candidatus Gemmiger faecigallinarum]|nr:hypothetical protein [Candidatus Gemmiger faecigallinarum]